MRMIQIDSKLSNTPIQIVNIRLKIKPTWWKQTENKKMNELDILDLLELDKHICFLWEQHTPILIDIIYFNPNAVSDT